MNGEIIDLTVLDGEIEITVDEFKQKCLQELDKKGKCGGR